MIEGDTTLLVKGKAKVKAENAELFGCRIDGNEITIPEGKVYPIYIPSDCKVEVEGDYIAVKGNTIPKTWEKLVEEGYRRIFLFGESDSGKSSLAVYLVNKCKLDVIDADIGQADLAHPGAMALGRAEGEIYSLEQLKLEDAVFVGVISPSGSEARCLKAFAKLVKKVRDCVVDTTGWVRGRRAVDYKLAKLEIFNADVVACFGEIPYYIKDFNVFRVESFVVKKRDREIRAVIRRKKYEEWFKDAELMKISLKDVIIKGTSLFCGEEFKDETLESFGDVTYAEKGYGFLNIYSESFDIGHEAIKALREIYNVEEVNIIKPSELENLLLGLYKDRYLSPALLKKVDFDEKKIEVLTSAKVKPSVIEFGKFKLDENMREVFVKI